MLPNYVISGPNAWKYEGEPNDMYVQEHTDLIASIRAGKPLNELKQVAESSLTAVMGRMSGDELSRVAHAGDAHVGTDAGAGRAAAGPGHDVGGSGAGADVYRSCAVVQCRTATSHSRQWISPETCS